MISDEGLRFRTFRGKILGSGGELRPDLFQRQRLLAVGASQSRGLKREKAALDAHCRHYEYRERERWQLVMWK